MNKVDETTNIDSPIIFNSNKGEFVGINNESLVQLQESISKKGVTRDIISIHEEIKNIAKNLNKKSERKSDDNYGSEYLVRCFLKYPKENRKD